MCLEIKVTSVTTAVHKHFFFKFFVLLKPFWMMTSAWVPDTVYTCLCGCWVKATNMSHRCSVKCCPQPDEIPLCGLTVWWRFPRHQTNLHVCSREGTMVAGGWNQSEAMLLAPNTSLQASASKTSLSSETVSMALIYTFRLSVPCGKEIEKNYKSLASDMAYFI